MHTEQSPLAGQTVKFKPESSFAGQQIVIEDWWDRLGSGSWRANASSNWACVNYSARVGFDSLPMDDEVLYGKIGGLGHLVHVSELVQS